MTTYYVTDNEKIGNIYLQKSRFVNSPNVWLEHPKYTALYNNGDAGAGYYWSVTEAPAMEKEQMGNWVRALYLNGSASAYVNASVTDHRMPVRCKAGTKDEATEAIDYYISLNVHNVTHIFLFDPDSETPLYKFPGRAVGSTDSSIKWQNFYCTTTVDPATLRVIFVKLEEDGKVRIFTRDRDYFKSTTSYNNNFLSNPDNYWTVDNGYYYDFCEQAFERPLGNVTLNKPNNPDCVTNPDSGGSGGGGGGSEEKYEGEFTWTGAIGVDGNWNGNCDELTNGKYDWSKVPENSTLTVWGEAWWSNITIRFSTSNGDWEKTQIISEVTYGSLDDPGWDEGSRRQWSYTFTLTRSMIDQLNQNGGLIIWGCNYQLQRIELRFPEGYGD